MDKCMEVGGHRVYLGKHSLSWPNHNRIIFFLIFSNWCYIALFVLICFFLTCQKIKYEIFIVSYDIIMWQKAMISFRPYAFEN